MTARELLLVQLAACHGSSGWFVSMQAALAGLSASQAAWRPEGPGHSIWEILSHVVFWNERYLTRFRGGAVENVDDNDATFEVEGAPGDEPTWRAACAGFDRVMNGWKEALRTADDAKLESPAVGWSPETWGSKLSHMTIHTANHIGQIVTLRRLQGSWDPGQGVS